MKVYHYIFLAITIIILIASVTVSLAGIIVGSNGNAGYIFMAIVGIVIAAASTITVIKLYHEIAIYNLFRR